MGAKKEKEEAMRIVFIGAGNLATHLAEACKTVGHEILQVYSRTMENAATLAAKTGADAINDLSQVNPAAHLYLFSVKDDALAAVIKQMP
ncbi:MAG: NAD(P)-binding domain-containing protein, partial [Proteiniphilum sp.]